MPRYEISDEKHKTNKSLFRIIKNGNPTNAYAVKSGVIFSDRCEIINGTFYGGTFQGGTFYGGTFQGGTFRGGTFYGGTFRGGTFRGGTFYGGIFDKSPIQFDRGDYVFTIHRDDNKIRIMAGCLNFSWKEAKEHWSNPNHPQGKNTMKIIKFLKQQLKEREGK